MKKQYAYWFALCLTLLSMLPLQAFSQNGQVLNFNGTGSYCSAVDYIGDGDNITLEARVNWAGTTGHNQCILLSGSCCTGYGIYVNNANNDSLALVLPGVSNLSLHAKLTVGKWQMLTLVRNNGKWVFYVDGVATGFNSNISPNPIIVGNDSLMVGATNYTSDFYSGSMDQVVIWGRPLCPGEVSARLSCQVSPNDEDIYALYNFNEGISGANNSSVTVLADSSLNYFDLTLNYFTLNGSSDNWLSDAGALTSYCSAYTTLSINTYYMSPICSGTKDSLIVQASGTGPFTYNWSNSIHKDTNVVSPASSVNYNVIVTDGFGCTLADTDSIKVFITPSVSITGKSPICAGVYDTLKASATGQGLMSYSWSTYDTKSAIVVQPYADSLFKVFVTDTNYCFDSAQITINVNPSPVLLGIVYSNLLGGTCLGVNDTLYEMVSGGPYTYSWNNGATTDTIIVSPNIPTEYKLVINDKTCSQSDSVHVNVFTPPTVSVSGTDSICPGAKDTINTKVTGIPPFQYLWSTYQQAPAIIVTPTVDSSFSVLVTDGNYCTSSASFTVNMNSKLSTIRIVSSSPHGLCQGENDTIWAKITGTGPYIYLWNNGATKDTIIVAPRDTTTYAVKVTETGGCFNKDSVTANVWRYVIKIVGDSMGYTGKTDTLIALYGSHFYWPDSVQGDTDFIVSKNITDTTFMVTGINSYGCPDTAYFGVTVVLAGVNNLSTEASTMYMYPNPASSVINLLFETSGGDKNAVVDILDITGRNIVQLHTTIINDKVLPIDISSLPAGNYFIRVTASNSVQQVLKFIKE